MALKENGSRTFFTATIKKENADTVKGLAVADGKSVGKTLDKIIEGYGKMRNDMLKRLCKKAAGVTSQERAAAVFDEYYDNGFTHDDMPLDFLEKWYPYAYREIMETY